MCDKILKVFSGVSCSYDNCCHQQCNLLLNCHRKVKFHTLYLFAMLFISAIFKIFAYFKNNIIKHFLKYKCGKKIKLTSRKLLPIKTRKFRPFTNNKMQQNETNLDLTATFPTAVGAFHANSRRVGYDTFGS